VLGDAAVERHQRHETARAQGAALRHLGDDADLGVAMTSLGHEQDALLVADIR